VPSRPTESLEREGLDLNIRVTGRSGDVTTRMKEKARQKVSKLLRIYERITWVDVVLSEDRQRKSAEVTAGLNRGNTIVGKAKGSDMYSAIDLAVDKIARQLKRHKEKLHDYRPKRAEGLEPMPEEEETEPTYEDAVEEHPED
jgi:putative sigma-54 modulation protein